MAQWQVDYQTKPGILSLTLEGSFSVSEIRQFVAAHNAGVDALAADGYRVFVDIRKLLPLSPECAREFERAKQYSAAQPKFQGSAVLATSSLIAMQHRRTSASGGVLDTELISDDEAACWAYLAQVTRNRGKANQGR